MSRSSSILWRIAKKKDLTKTSHNGNINLHIIPQFTINKKKLLDYLKDSSV